MDLRASQFGLITAACVKTTASFLLNVTLRTLQKTPLRSEHKADVDGLRNLGTRSGSLRPVVATFAALLPSTIARLFEWEHVTRPSVGQIRRSIVATGCDVTGLSSGVGPIARITQLEINSTELRQ